MYKCPKCGLILLKVIQTNFILNKYQFDVIKAGDFYCKVCRGDRGKSGDRYFWESELENQAQKPEEKIEGKVTMEEVIRFTLERFSNLTPGTYGAAIANVKMNMEAWKKMRSEGKWPNPPSPTASSCTCENHDTGRDIPDPNCKAHPTPTEPEPCREHLNFNCGVCTPTPTAKENQ